MSIPYNDLPAQPGNPDVVPAAAAGVPVCPLDAAAAMPDICPCCGRTYDLFDHNTSRLLDWIERLHDDLHHLKHAVEEVLP